MPQVDFFTSQPRRVKSARITQDTADSIPNAVADVQARTGIPIDHWDDDDGAIIIDVNNPNKRTVLEISSVIIRSAQNIASHS